MKTLLAGILLMALSVPVLAQQVIPKTDFQDWEAGMSTNKADTYAATMNMDGSVLAEYCGKTAGCHWELKTTVPCKEDGNKQIVLINGNTSYNPVEASCVGQKNGQYGLKLDWHWLETILGDTTNTQLAVAIPLEGAQFRVVHFSLRGVIEATAFAGGAVTGERHDGPTVSGYRDTTL